MSSHFVFFLSLFLKTDFWSRAIALATKWVDGTELSHDPDSTASSEQEKRQENDPSFNLIDQQEGLGDLF